MPQLRRVTPCGMLHSQGREYFLLHNEPLAKDSWQGDNLYRFVVVPAKPVDFWQEQTDAPIYSNARHIVSNAFTIEFQAGMPDIMVRILDENDVLDHAEPWKAGEPNISNVAQVRIPPDLIEYPYTE